MCLPTPPSWFSTCGFYVNLVFKVGVCLLGTPAPPKSFYFHAIILTYLFTFWGRIIYYHGIVAIDQIGH